MKKKLAIIVPYRDRETHLKTFITHMKTYLKGFKYEIIVIEQKDNKPFNRGKLLNVGAKYAIDNGFDYMCFHDVDLLPINADYSYPEYPTSLITELENSDSNIFFSYFGGITLFNVDDFVSINGYSNDYWGWGYEDTDLFYRVTHGGLFFESKMVGKDDNSMFSIDLVEKDYIKIPINPFFLEDDFTFKITAKIETKYFDENKEYDEYPIMSIPGHNIGIFYNSFNRYFLQVYDEDYKSYSITSEILDNVVSEFTFKKEGNKVSFIMNDILVGEIEMGSPILNLGNEFIYVGSFSENENVEFDIKVIDIEVSGKQLTINDFEIFGGIVNVDHTISHRTSLPKPVRREGLFRELYHDSNASINKSWIHQETRKNQIYFNNFVKQNKINFNQDGLNTLEFTLVSEEKNIGYKKISVEL